MFNIVSVTFGVLFSYASIIFLEFYFRDSKEPRENRNSRNKGLKKMKESTVPFVLPVSFWRGHFIFS